MKAAVFVDQAPLQNRAEDWALGSKGCYDAVSLDAPAGAAEVRLHGVHQRERDGVSAIPSIPGTPQLLMAETMKADPVGLADAHGGPHAAGLAPRAETDRRAVPGVGGREVADLPAGGRQGGGAAHPGARTVVFEHEDHWLYIEDFRIPPTW